MDRLSLALAETHTRGSLMATLDLAAPWSIDFEQSIGVPIHCVLEGEAWVQLDRGASIKLGTGDIVMFSRWDRHYLTCDPQIENPVTISELVRRNGQTLWSQGQWLEEPLQLSHPGTGRRTTLLSVVVEPSRGAADELLVTLPRMVRLSANGDVDLTAWLTILSQFMAREAAGRTPGYAIIQSRLSELLFMQVVRSQLFAVPGGQTAALRILLDGALSRVFAAVRAEPAKRWTLGDMARVGGLSRSAFAAHFLKTAGMTPFEFLRGLRLDAAAERLKQGDPVKALIEQAGYRTPYSFAKAFKKRFAMTPGAYRASFHDKRGL